MGRLFSISIVCSLFICWLAWIVVEADKKTVIDNSSKTISYTSEVGRNLMKIEWDGHLWIILNGESIAHHPDCPCGKKEFEKPEETSATE